MFSQRIEIHLDGIGDAFHKMLTIYLRHAFAPVSAFHDRLEAEGRLTPEERDQLRAAIDDELGRAREWLDDEMADESPEPTDQMGGDQ